MPTTLWSQTLQILWCLLSAQLSRPYLRAWRYLHMHIHYLLVRLLTMFGSANIRLNSFTTFVDIVAQSQWVISIHDNSCSDVKVPCARKHLLSMLCGLFRYVPYHHFNANTNAFPDLQHRRTSCPGQKVEIVDYMDDFSRGYKPLKMISSNTRATYSITWIVMLQVSDSSSLLPLERTIYRQKPTYSVSKLRNFVWTGIPPHLLCGK